MPSQYNGCTMSGAQHPALQHRERMLPLENYPVSRDLFLITSGAMGSLHPSPSPRTGFSHQHSCHIQMLLVLRETAAQPTAAPCFACNCFGTIVCAQLFRANLHPAAGAGGAAHASRGAGEEEGAPAGSPLCRGGSDAVPGVGWAPPQPFLPA